MSDQSQAFVSSDEAPAAVDVSDSQPISENVEPEQARVQEAAATDNNDNDEIERLSAIEQSTITLHEQSSARSHSTAGQPTRPSTASILRPASAFHLPVDPRFPSDPSPQLLAVLQAADEADRLTANSHSPLLTERTAAAAERGQRPESATPLGGLDTLQGLPSHSVDYAWSVMQSKMRWRESTRAERAARVERRKEELLAEFAAEVNGSAISLTTVKPQIATRSGDKSTKMSTVKRPLSVAIAVS